jgi:hypothetical protein
MEKLHNLSTAFNVIEKVRPHKKEYRITDLKDWHVWECQCRDGRVFLRRKTSPGKLFLIWRKEEDKFINGDHTHRRSIFGEIYDFKTYS